MTDISAKALAVLCAANRRYAIDGDLQDSVVAALRAAADQVVPREPAKDPLWASAAYRQRADIRAHILAIAAELEGGNG